MPHLLSGADTDLDEGIPLLQLVSQHVPVPSQSEIKSPDDKKVRLSKSMKINLS